jgi:hypothetical protein
MLAVMEAERGMRAGDTDREATAERLRVALEEGRLGLHEYDERLARVYAAKTYAELDEVLSDLPGPAPVERSAVVPVGPPASVPAPAGEPAEPASRDGLLGLWAPWLRVAAVVVPIWLLVSIGSRSLGYFWPAWVLGPWGVLLLMQSTGRLGQGRGRDGRRDGRERRRGR